MTIERILVFGATGMLGFALQRSFHDAGYDVVGVVRNPGFASHPWCHGLRFVRLADLGDGEELQEIIAASRPQIVVNAIGAKQYRDAREQLEMFKVNCVFPHVLSHLCAQFGAKLIHFSTDGVFSGHKGSYLESSRPDAADFYGQSKYVGEPLRDAALVIRCSMIGLSPIKQDSLVDWVLSSTGTIRGFVHSYFNGLPVDELARVLMKHVFPRIIELTGVVHLHAPTLSKFELLCRIIDVWNIRDLVVVPDTSVALDRSLCSRRSEQETGFVSPAWEVLMPRMKGFYQGIKV